MAQQLFGKSVNDSSLITQIVFGIKLICLNGSSKFLIKVIPISKLISASLFEQNDLTVQAITLCTS